MRWENFTGRGLLPYKIFDLLGRDTSKAQVNASIVDSGRYACVYADNFDQEDCSALAPLDFCREQHSTLPRLQVPVSFDKKGA